MFKSSRVNGHFNRLVQANALLATTVSVMMALPGCSSVSPVSPIRATSASQPNLTAASKVAFANSVEEANVNRIEADFVNARQATEQQQNGVRPGFGFTILNRRSDEDSACTSAGTGRLLIVTGDGQLSTGTGKLVSTDNEGKLKSKSGKLKANNGKVKSKSGKLFNVSASGHLRTDDGKKIVSSGSGHLRTEDGTIVSHGGLKTTGCDNITPPSSTNTRNDDDTNKLKSWNDNDDDDNVRANDGSGFVRTDTCKLVKDNDGSIKKQHGTGDLDAKEKKDRDDDVDNGKKMGQKDSDEDKVSRGDGHLKQKPHDDKGLGDDKNGQDKDQKNKVASTNTTTENGGGNGNGNANGFKTKTASTVVNPGDLEDHDLASSCGVCSGKGDDETRDAHQVRPFTVHGNTIYMKSFAKDAYVHIINSDWFLYVTNADGSGKWYRVFNLDPTQTVHFHGNCADNIITLDTDNNSVVWKVSVFGEQGNDRLTLDATKGGLAQWSVLHGNEGNDVLTAKGAATIYYGDAGDDILNGSEFDDTMYGGSGDDTIMGNAGNDVIFGGSTEDCIHGDAGSDTIEGGSGGDYISGDEEYDCIHGDSGNDTIDGGDGGDYIGGGSGNDVIHGDGLSEAALSLHPGNDTIDGGPGNDWIEANAGNDTVHACGSDIDCATTDTAKVFGNEGDDYIFDDGKTATIDGGPGADIIIRENLQTSVTPDSNDTVRGA